MRGSSDLLPRSSWLSFLSAAERRALNRDLVNLSGSLCLLYPAPFVFCVSVTFRQIHRNPSSGNESRFENRFPLLLSTPLCTRFRYLMCQSCSLDISWRFQMSLFLSLCQACYPRCWSQGSPGRPPSPASKRIRNMCFYFNLQSDNSLFSAASCPLR